MVRIVTMARTYGEETYLYLTSKGSLQYYNDNTPSRFKNSIEPIRFENGVDYEVAISNLLIPDVKNRILEVRKLDPTFEITFETKNLNNNHEVLFVYRPSRDMIGAAKDVIEELNKDMRTQYMYNITRRIQLIKSMGGSTYDPRIDLVHMNFFKILNNRVCFYKNPIWQEIYTETEYQIMQNEQNSLGPLKSNEIYLPEWNEFSSGNDDQDEVWQSIQMTFAGGIAAMLGFVAERRYTIYDAHSLFPVTFRSTKPLNLESDFLIIESDIVELTRFANTKTSILDAFPSNRQKLIAKTLYKPLKSVSELNSVSIMIHNEEGDLVEYDPESVVIICLHIRPKRKFAFNKPLE